MLREEVCKPQMKEGIVLFQFAVWFAIWWALSSDADAFILSESMHSIVSASDHKTQQSVHFANLVTGFLQYWLLVRYRLSTTKMKQTTLSFPVISKDAYAEQCHQAFASMEEVTKQIHAAEEVKANQEYENRREYEREKKRYQRFMTRRRHAVASSLKLNRDSNGKPKSVVTFRCLSYMCYRHRYRQSYWCELGQLRQRVMLGHQWLGEFQCHLHVAWLLTCL